MDSNGLSKIQYTTHDAANVLGISEAEFRILAKRHELTAPFNDEMIDVIRGDLNNPHPTENTHTEPQQALQQHQTANLTQSSSPAFSLFCDALELEIINNLSAEMRSRMPSIKAAVIDNVLPQN